MTTTAPSVWKFGYGSNISPAFLREKKQLTVLDWRRCILRGFSLSFPEGRGISYVEPAFATLRRDPDGEVHGTACLFPSADALKLDRQEQSYNVESCKVQLYSAAGAAGEEEISGVEVYTAKRPEPEGFPQGCCSERYKNILVAGAVEMELEPAWIQRLRSLQVYTPSSETMEQRAALPPPSMLPQLTLAELATSDIVYACVCGYVFDHKSIFQAHHGRDITFRVSLHRRGISMDANDTDPHGRDPSTGRFPTLAEIEPTELEYAKQWLDRFRAVGGPPVGALREFWEEQQV